MNRRRATWLLTLVLAGAATMMVLGAWDRTNPAMYRLALGVAIFAGTGLMMLRTTFSAKALERARQEGYFSGFAAAKQRSGSARGLLYALPRSPEQLLQEGDVTDSA